MKYLTFLFILPIYFVLTGFIIRQEPPIYEMFEELTAESINGYEIIEEYTYSNLCGRPLNIKLYNNGVLHINKEIQLCGSTYSALLDYALTYEETGISDKLSFKTTPINLYFYIGIENEVNLFNRVQYGSGGDNTFNTSLFLSREDVPSKDGILNYVNEIVDGFIETFKTIFTFNENGIFNAFVSYNEELDTRSLNQFGKLSIFGVGFGLLLFAFKSVLSYLNLRGR